MSWRQTQSQFNSSTRAPLKLNSTLNNNNNNDDFNPQNRNTNNNISSSNSNSKQIDGLAPTFQKKPSIKHENSGRRLVFECLVLANPKPIVKWFYNGLPLDESSSRFSTNVSACSAAELRELSNAANADEQQAPVNSTLGKLFKGSLTITDISIADAGRYKVIASNELGESQASISLNFDADDKQQQDELLSSNANLRPTFIEKPLISQAKDSKSIKFECKLLAKPMPTIVWLHKGCEVNSSSAQYSQRLMPTKDANSYIASLTLNGVDASLAGEYKCTASNVAGSGQATINLNFEQGKAKIPDGRVPRFPRKPLIRQRGASLCLECVLEAKPRPRVSWFRGGELIVQDARHSFSEKGPLSRPSELSLLELDESELVDNDGKAREFYVLTLEISRPTASDGGAYRCHAVNELGESNANISLNFQHNEQQQQQQLQQEQEEQEQEKRLKQQQKDNKSLEESTTKQQQTKQNLLNKKTDSTTTTTTTTTTVEQQQQQQQQQLQTANNRRSQESAASSEELRELEKLARKLSASLGESRRSSSASNKRAGELSGESSRRSSKQLALVADATTTAAQQQQQQRRQSSNASSTTPSRRTSTLTVPNSSDINNNDYGEQAMQVDDAQATPAKRTTSVKKKKRLSLASNASDLDASDALTQPASRKTSVKRKVSVKRKAELENINEAADKLPPVSISVESPPQQQQQQQQLLQTSDDKKPPRKQQASSNQQPPTQQPPQPQPQLQTRGPKLSISEAPAEISEKRRGTYDNLRGDTTVDADDSEEAEAQRRYFATRGGGGAQQAGRESLSPTGSRGSQSGLLGAGQGREGSPNSRQGSLEPVGRRGSVLQLPELGDERRPSLIVPTDNKLRPGEIADRRRRSSIDVRRASVFETDLADKPSTPLRPVGKKPQLVDYQDNVSGCENRTSFLTFGVEGDPVPTLRFFKGESEIFETGRYSVVTDGETNSVSFCIRKSKPIDEARYKIIASNEHGEDVAYMQLFVSDESGMDFRAMLKHRQYAKWKKDQDDPNWGNLKSVEEERLAAIKEPKRPDNFLKPPQNQRAKQGKDLKVRFECVFSKSGVKAKWFRNNKEIFPNKKFHLNSTGDLHVLEIESPFVDDAGRYTCQCLDTKCTATLEVDEPDPVYKFTKLLAKGYGQHLNRELVLECTSNSSRAQVEWFKNDKRCLNELAKITSDGQKYIVESDKFGKKILRVKNCSFDDSGEYSCKIINTPIDDEITTTQVLITEKKFQIIKPLYSQRASEDDKIVLECEVDELDAPVKWFRKDRSTNEWKEINVNELKSSSKQIIVDGKKRRLIIKKAKCNDEGEYKCATNADETTCELFVEPSNKWRKKLVDVTVIEGEQLMLEAELMDRKPGVSLRWTRNNRELGIQGGGGVQTTADERVSFKLIDDKYQMIIDSASVSADAGDWSVACGKLKCSCKVTVLPAEKAPSFEFPTSTIVADVGKQTIVEIPYKVAGTKMSPVNAQVLLKGKPITDKDKVEIIVRDDKVLLRFKDPQTSDSSDQYQLVLENAKGKCASKFALKVEGVPSAPQGPLKISDVTKDKCKLEWQKPLDNGGSEIAHYIVERQEVGSGRTTWTECGITSTTQLDITDLSEKKEYKFRVKAVNKKGKSEPLVATKTIIAKDPYDPPGEPENLTVTNWDKDFADLSWDAPTSDGGIAIESYVIEAKNKFESEWSEVDRVNASAGCKAHVTNKEKLKENAQVQFRVKAVNKAGAGQASKATKPVQLKARFVRPHLFGDGLKNIVVKKGRPIRYEINFGGEPEPQVKWFANETELVNTSNRIEIDTSSKKTTLTVTNTTRIDSGRYKIIITNSSGEVKSEADVVVLDRPSAPEGPLVMEEIKVDQVTIKWRKPKDKGGVENIDGYVIEKMNVESGRWIPAGECSANDEMFTVKGLMKGKKYKFRVRAKNNEGESDALETNNVLDVGEEPTIEKCPSLVTVNEGGHARVKIRFSGEPTEFKLINLDTNETVSEYKTDPTSGDLKSTGADETSNVKLSILDDYLALSVNNAKLKNKARYKLQLKNKQGTDDAEFDLNVTGMPGKPQGPLEVTDVTENSASLSWRPPADDGGAKVTHYIVERKDASREGDDAWIEVATNCVATSFTVPNLTKNTAYKFRIRAVNENGQSEPLDSEIDVIAKLPFDKPSAPKQPQVSAVGEDFVVLDWDKPDSDGGSRIQGYVIEKREVGSETWQKVNLQEPCLTNQATIKNLVEDRKYEFRVSAINAAGSSEPSECSAQTLIKDPNAKEVPNFVEPLKKVTGTEGSTFELTCTVQGNPSPSVVWFKGSKELRDGSKYKITQTEGENNTTIHTLTVFNATGDDADEYSARATNKAGSRTTRADAVIKTKPKINVPVRLCGSSSSSGDINDAAAAAAAVQFDRGESITLKIPFTGNPTPTIRWFKGDEEIEPSAQFDIETDDRHTTLTIRDATREDSGEYRLVAENELGSDSATICVSVSDRPEPPRFPVLESVCEDAATLAWQPPQWDGGSSITQYVIEKRELPMTSWIKAATTRFLSHQVVNLNEDKEYEFRIFAENIYGRSEPSTIVKTATKPSKREKRKSNWLLDENGNKIRTTNKNDDDDNNINDYDKFVRDLPTNHSAADIKTTPITDNYEIYEKIGEGVFGEVYRVKEKLTGDFYAAKFTKTNTNEEKALVRKEIDVVNALHHKNLLRLHDAYEDDDEIITVHEFISGSELLEKAAAGTDDGDDKYAMTEELVRRYMRDICDGVRHMHDRNVIHLDLKPEMLVLQSQKPLNENHEPKVKIVDFGLACKLDPHEICKISTTAVDYAAPEILEKDSVGFYTDMWSIGVLAYTLLCGKPPFDSSAANVKACQWSFDNNSSVFNNVSAEAKDFIEKLLVRQKEKRLTAHECLEHPWLARDGDEATRLKRNQPLCKSSEYRRERDSMRHRYLDWWQKSKVPIGHISNYGPLRKLYADRYKIHDALVDRRELAPRFVIKPQSAFAYEGQSAKFYCMISSSSAFTISWLKDNKELKQSVKYMKRFSFNNDYTFIVNRCLLADLGEYTIRAENAHGARDETVLLNVRPRPVDFTSIPLEPMRRRREPQPPKFEEEPDCAPSFNFRLRPRTIQAGNGVKLLCCVRGKPTPTITWFKDGRELNKRDYTMKHTDGVATLEIEACKVTDSGKYTCSAQNSLGDDESTADVLIEPKRTFTPAPLSTFLPASYSPPTPLQRHTRSASLTRALSPTITPSSTTTTTTTTPASRVGSYVRTRAQTPEPQTKTHTLYNSSYSIKTNRYLRRSYKHESARSFGARTTRVPFTPNSTRLPMRTISSFGRSSSSMGL